MMAKRKAIFIRLDKIGDLICTLPVDQASFLKDWEITWVISKGLSFIPEQASPRRKFIELDKSRPQEARRHLEQLLQEIQPAVAVSFQAPWWVSYVLWKSRVALRIGVLSKWDSFIFLNAGLRQKRSQALQHEADYNMDLVRQMLPLTSQTDPVVQTPLLRLQAEPQAELLKTHHLEPQRYVVVHPGMAGSALNWPIPYYIELIGKLKKSHRVVLTGTPADETWLKKIKEAFPKDPQVLCLQNQLTSRQLLYVLEQAKTVFAPSTGVLHLAAALGTQVFGFYSPIRVQTEKRWGARGPHVRLLTPEVNCPAVHECLGAKCPLYPCMEKITPAQVLKEV